MSYPQIIKTFPHNYANPRSKNVSLGRSGIRGFVAKIATAGKQFKTKHRQPAVFCSFFGGKKGKVSLAALLCKFEKDAIEITDSVTENKRPEAS